MDLDKEELEATRKMQSSGESAEKTADEMFEELGYTYIDRLKNGIEYFNEEDESIGIFNYENSGKRITYSRFECISIEELQAINKKCFELGWLDE